MEDDFEEKNYINCLSAKEISKNILYKLKYNSNYDFISEIQNKLFEKGLSEEEINELMIRKLAILISEMDNSMRINSSIVYYSFNKIINSIDFSKRFNKNQKIYKIKVSLDKYDELIYRIYEVSSMNYLSNLAYIILSTFNTLAYHLYKFEFYGDIYHCNIESENIFEYEISSTDITLNQLLLQIGDKIDMIYDFGDNWKFNIEVIDILKRDKNKEYPYIVEGKGKGIIEDNSFLLDEFIKLNNKNKPSSYDFGNGKINFDFDYREFNLKKLNDKLKNNIRKIKNNYENYE
ncbi:MAG: plasmid pRiA4b ORF-3 family protein [Clostridia bacterium]